MFTHANYLLLQTDMMHYRALHHVKHSFKHNWHCLRCHPLGELAGSLGDLGTIHRIASSVPSLTVGLQGTLLPILIAMTTAGSISITSTLVFCGIWNLLSGTLFGVPIVVLDNQPINQLVPKQTGLGC